MGKKNVSLAVEQKITAGLVNIIAGICVQLHPFAPQGPVELQCRRGKHPKPGQTAKSERLISLALRIGEDRKRPAVPLLIVDQPRRLGKRHDSDPDPPTVELIFQGAHLAEVSLAWQSSQVPKKDQQQVALKVFPEIRRLAVQINQRQLIEGYLSHTVERS